MSNKDPMAGYRMNKEDEEVYYAFSREIGSGDLFRSIDDTEDGLIASWRVLFSRVLSDVKSNNPGTNDSEHYRACRDFIINHKE